MLLHYKDLAAVEIKQYGITQMSVVEGVLCQDGRPLYDADVPVRVSIYAPVLSPNAVQGLLGSVRETKYGLKHIEIFERRVNKDGYYVSPSSAPCSDKSMVITTYNVDESFLTFGWTERQGNTAGLTIPFPFKNHNPHSQHRPRADVAYII